MQVSSTAFQRGGLIPEQYTADGRNMSPPLTWSGAPENTQSFALICDDPDAPRGIWVHWVIFNIPGTTTRLGESVPIQKELSTGARQGTNDFRRIGYGGPAPPPGKPHRYFFKLYALDTMLDLREGSNKQQLLDAMKGHTLAECNYMGRYEREEKE